MNDMTYIWQNGKLKPWADAQVHVLTHTLHYGGGAFEGIRFYDTTRGPAVFRHEDHINRLIYSTQQLGMKLKYQVPDICQFIVELIHANKISEGYVRPLVYFGNQKLRVSSAGNIEELIIACWPWGKYLAEDSVDIKTSKYIRSHPKSTIPDAKLCGNYLNGQLAALEIEGTKYHEVLTLDYEGHVAEGAGENIFIIKDKVLYTPQVGNILPGITRDTIMKLARAQGLTVKECQLNLEDVYRSDEAFFTGTAAEVTAIRSVDDQLIGQGDIGPLTQDLKEQYHLLTRGKIEKYLNYLYFINEPNGGHS